MSKKPQVLSSPTTGVPAVLLTPQAVAKILHVSVGTLAVWRSTRRYALRYVKIGRKVCYLQADVEEFINSRTKGGVL